MGEIPHVRGHLVNGNVTEAEPDNSIEMPNLVTQERFDWILVNTTIFVW